VPSGRFFLTRIIKHKPFVISVRVVPPLRDTSKPINIDTDAASASFDSGEFLESI